MRDHVRLVVRDIGRSKAFYRQVLGRAPARDFTDQLGDRSARSDPDRLFAGCEFEVGDQRLDLRPARTDTIADVPDHVTLELSSVAELKAVARRLDEARVPHSPVRSLTGIGIAVLEVHDPDDVDLELSAAL